MPVFLTLNPSYGLLFLKPFQYDIPLGISPKSFNTILSLYLSLTFNDCLS